MLAKAVLAKAVLEQAVLAKVVLAKATARYTNARACTEPNLRHRERANTPVWNFVGIHWPTTRLKCTSSRK